MLIPSYFLITPPLGAEKGSSLASEYAIMYPMFHWGIIPWSIYIFPAIPIAYSHFVCKQPYLRLSIASSSILGKQATGHWVKLLMLLLFLQSWVGLVPHLV